MSKRDKLVAMIVARPPEASYNDVERLLLEFGWSKKPDPGGSHHKFSKHGEGILIIPKKSGKTVKRTYLNQICTKLRLDDLAEQD